MNPRTKRLANDYRDVLQAFASSEKIKVVPGSEMPPENYRVTYYVPGIYRSPDGTIEKRSVHEVDIQLTAEYPGIKPRCIITTPIWHPNFNGGEICIGDIWGADESLRDIIVYIGRMIQYQEWNANSPLSHEAAEWALENAPKGMFPVGNIELGVPEYDVPSETGSREYAAPLLFSGSFFEITEEELAGVEFVPSAIRKQGSEADRPVRGKRINTAAVFQKGLLWAFLGIVCAIIVTELCGGWLNTLAGNLTGYPGLEDIMQYHEKAQAAAMRYDTAEKEKYQELMLKALLEASQYGSMKNEKDIRQKEILALSQYGPIGSAVNKTERVKSGMWVAIIALLLGLFMGIGEGVYYGAWDRAVQYGAAGAAVSMVIGYAGGWLAQYMYAAHIGGMTDESALDIYIASLVRGIGWAVFGLGIGFAAGLIRPGMKRIAYCSLGGAVGAFAGGFLFNYICMVFPDEIAGRAAGLFVTAMLIGLGTGLAEQLAKEAWLKVVRGEFAGKEYIVFPGSTRIGNNSQNNIVLFKDTLVKPRHCTIILRGNRYEIIPHEGSVTVNGITVSQKSLLHSGDSVACGNTVMVFNVKE